MVIMANFELYSTKRDGTYLATLPFRDLQAEFKLNGTNAMRWTISFDTLRHLSKTQLWPGLTEVKLYRNGRNIFTGPLWTMQVSSNESKVTLGAMGIESYFSSRLTMLTGKFTGQFAEAAWKMIDNSQKQTGGDLGITRGRVAGNSAPTGTIKWSPTKTIEETHEELFDGKNGFDWEITPSRIYNQFVPRLSGEARTSLEYGYNIRNYSIGYSGNYIANYVVAAGRDNYVTPPSIDTASRNKYGLRQKSVSNTSLQHKPLLINLAASTLQMRREVKVSPQVSIIPDMLSPFDGDLWQGQLVNVSIDNGWDVVNQKLRCVGYQLTVGRHHEEVYSIFFNDDRELDE